MGSNPKSLTITFTYSYLVVHNLQINHSRYCKIYIRKHTHKHTLTEGRGRYACKSNFYNVTTNQTLESAKYKLTKMFRYFEFFFYFYVYTGGSKAYLHSISRKATQMWIKSNFGILHCVSYHRAIRF